MRIGMLLSLLALLASTSLQAQRQETLFGHNGLGITGMWGSATYNYSFFDEDYVYNRGGNIGLEFGNNFFVGYGWSRFRENANPEGARSFRMRYNGVLLAVAPGAYQAVHPRISALIGGGRVFPDNLPRSQVFVFQPSAGIEVNVFQWFRVGLEGGYRIVTNSSTPDLSSTDISSPFAQIDLRFGFTRRR